MPGATKARAASTYRGARRNAARKHHLAWKPQSYVHYTKDFPRREYPIAVRYEPVQARGWNWLIGNATKRLATKLGASQ